MTTPDERDRWLEQALRHAPDADVTPPAELRAAILSRALDGPPTVGGSLRAVHPHRQGKAPPSPLPSPASGRGSSYPGSSSAAQWLACAFAWLSRPPVAAGLATLAVSTVLGTLWWGGSLDEGADPRVAESIPAPAPSPTPSPAPAAAPETATPTPAAPQMHAASAPGAAQKSRRALERPASPDTPARAAEAVRTEPAPAAAPPPPAQGAPDAPAAVDATRSPAQNDPLRASRSATAQALAGAATEQRIDARGDPVDAIASSLALRADALHWASGGRTHAHAVPQQAWFDALRQATAGRWQRTRTADRDGARVQLFDGPRVRAEWLVQAQRVLWLDAESGTWQATLEPADAARLRAMADAW